MSPYKFLRVNLTVLLDSTVLPAVSYDASCASVGLSKPDTFQIFMYEPDPSSCKVTFPPGQN